MKKIILLLTTTFSLIVIGFAINTINVQQAKGQASLPGGYYTGIKDCPDGKLVIRCQIGDGDCEAEDQKFCDEV